MLHSCAEYLTHTLYRHCPLSEEKRPVFVYGFELSLSTLSSILSIILLSIIADYIDYYNNSRIQAKTKWMPPSKFREASMMEA